MNSNLQPCRRIASLHLLYLFVLLIFAGVYVSVGKLDEVSTNILLLHFNNIVMGLALVFVVVFFFKAVDKKKPAAFGFCFTKKDFQFSAMVLLYSLLFAGAFIGWLDFREVLQAEIRWGIFSEGGYYGLLLFAVLGWIIAALKEEVLSRGYVLFNLRHLRIEVMMLVSALLFMALHIPTSGADPSKLVSWFFGGLVYAYIYIKSGSIWTVTVSHAIHNYVNDLMIGNNPQFAVIMLNQPVAGGDKLLYEIALKLSIILLAAFLYKKRVPASRF